LRSRRDQAADLLGRAIGEDRKLAGGHVDGERHAQSGVAARDLLERQHVRDEVGACAAVFGRDARAEQAQLAHLRQDVLGERVLAVPCRRLGRHDLVGKAPREVADLPLFVGQVMHGCGRPSGSRRPPR
jgi:hypothetical protein